MVWGFLNHARRTSSLGQWPSGLVGSFRLRTKVVLGMAGLDVSAWARQAEGILTLPADVPVVPPRGHFSETNHLSPCFSTLNVNGDHLRILFKCRF